MPRDGEGSGTFWFRLKISIFGFLFGFTRCDFAKSFVLCSLVIFWKVFLHLRAALTSATPALSSAAHRAASPVPAPGMLSVAGGWTRGCDFLSPVPTGCYFPSCSVLGG